jgi:hypothetical protein
MDVDERKRTFIANVHALEDEAQRYACPIYGVKGDVGKPIGSGFLLRIRDHTFLVTAAHVLYERHFCTLQLPGQTRLVPFGGSLYSTGPRELVKEPDFGIDIALMDLRLSEMLETPDARVLSLGDLDASDLPAAQVAYGAVGFPGSENQAIAGRAFRRSSFYYGGEPANQPKYEILGYDHRSHFIIMFDQQKMIDRSGKEVEVPEPFGMSGGPTLKVGTFPEIEAGDARPRVVALIVEWAPKLKALVAVRMSMVLETIRELVPELKADIPEADHARPSISLRKD